MLFRTIRNIVSVGAALGFAHGGWESCSQVLTEISSAATHPERADPHQTRAECSEAFLSVIGSRTPCNVRNPTVRCFAADANVHEPAPRVRNGHPVQAVLTEVDANAAEKRETRDRVPASIERAAPHPETLPSRPETLLGARTC